jgi:hypothetical protein
MPAVLPRQKVAPWVGVLRAGIGRHPAYSRLGESGFCTGVGADGARGYSAVMADSEQPGSMVRADAGNPRSAIS